MRNSILLLLLALIIGTLMALPAYAQVGSCATGTAEAYLSSNNVRARILNTGGMFYRGEPHVYEVPRGGAVQAIFGSGIWLGGMVSSTLRVAGTRYGPFEFWPGPVATALSGSQACAAYDRVYHIVERDLNALNAGGTPNSDIVDWPWQFGAPVVDGDGNPDNYDLEAGDRPEILGEESVFFIMNDVGNLHTSTGSGALGVEVHVTAFSAGSTDPDIDNSTFYRYRIYNRNALPIKSMLMGIFSDMDLGNANDDLVGSDPLLNLAYTYNGDNDDEVGSLGYGASPPAVGYQVLGGSVVDTDGLDNDNDGLIDEPGEQIGLYSFLSWSNGAGVQGIPQTGADLYNHMQGKWKDGNPVTEGGNGYQTGGPVTRYMYPGDIAGYWSESDIDGFGTPNFPGDRRFSAGVGPVDLNPGEYKDVFLAVIWARGSDNLDSVTELKAMAGRLAGKTPDQIVGNSPTGIVATPEPLVPADRSFGQPFDTVLRWYSNAGPDYSFEVQLADNDGFLNALSLFTDNDNIALLGQLQLDKNYVWRVRAFNSVVSSSWSSAFSFSTGDENFSNVRLFDRFSVVANAAGPLLPPDMGAFAFNNSGFPTIECPNNPLAQCDRPLTGYQQATGPAVWGIHTGGNGTRLTYTSFVSRVLRDGANDPLPYDYEIRFTGTSLHYDRYFTGTILTGDPLPFEVWNTGIGTPTDPSDDFRMIVVGLDLELDGWGIRDVDHELSGGDNDPETDWFYVHEPLDTSPGSVGYDAWAEGALVDPGNNLGREIFARLVFVNWNGGSVSAVPAIYNATMPEAGTIFRIETSEFPPPALAAPGNNDFSVPGSVPFFWNSGSIGEDRLIVANDAALASVIVDLPNVSPGQTVTLPVGTYYWQVIGINSGTSSGESEIWRVNVANPAQYDVLVDAGWNLLGIPFSATDMSSTSLFGAQTAETVTTFNGQYVRPAFGQVQRGRGYWVKFTGAGLVSNDVFVRPLIEFDLEPGWNMISGPGCSLDASLVTGDTDVIAAGTLFGYAAGAYFLATEYVGGSGYWLFADAPGNIILDCDLVGGKRGRSDLELLAGYGSFRLTPHDQGAQTLYFGGSIPDDLSDKAFSLPPMAPSQTWRAQFVDGKYVTQNVTATIDLVGADFPITLDRGNIGPADGMKIVIRDASGNTIEDAIVVNGESFILNRADAASLEISVLSGITTAIESSDLPQDFELQQNYPNPFNPVTNIRFALPAADDVSILIMDVTGRVVADILRKQPLSSGWHSVSFDARDLASGVYFYRVSTTVESMTKSMVLLK